MKINIDTTHTDGKFLRDEKPLTKKAKKKVKTVKKVNKIKKTK